MAALTMREKKAHIDRYGHLRLFEHLLGHEVRVGKTFTSPIRAERNPSFNVFRGRYGYRWKDFAGESGTIYDLAMRMHAIDFKAAIDLLYGFTGGEIPAVHTMKRPMFIGPKKKGAVIECTYREWSEADTSFWLRWNIGLLVLLKYNVNSIEKASIRSSTGKVTELVHEVENPLYGIHINKKVKVYRPLNPNKKMKMLGNTGSDEVFGLEQAEMKGCRVRDIVLSGGNKDALAWICNGMGDDLLAVSMNSETTHIQEHVMLRISKCAERVWICYDNDTTGIKAQEAQKMRYPFLRTIQLGQFTKRKDFADLVESRDKEALMAIRSILIA